MAPPFFGEPWGAPVCEEAPQVQAPVGASCQGCATPILRGEQGLLLAFVREDGGQGAAPWHHECLLCAVAGPWAGADPRVPGDDAGCGGGGRSLSPAQCRAQALAWHRSQALAAWRAALDEEVR